MSVVAPVTDRPALGDAVVPAATVLAGFEIGMLMRCVRTGSGLVSAPTAVEFGRAAAASRLMRLLDVVGLPGRPEQYAAGGWHRYTVHRVTCPGLRHPLLDRAWCIAYQRLCAQVGYRSPRQRQHLVDLATAAWRAALLVGGRRARGPVGLRVTDADVALVLVRAARVLGVPVTLRSVTGRHLVEAGAGLRELAG